MSRPRATVPKAINVKASKLVADGLYSAYEWLKVDRAFGLEKAMAWFDENVPILLFKQPLDAAGQKRYDQASKARKLASGTDQSGERDQACRTAIRIYEKLFSFDSTTLPRIDAAFTAADVGEKPKGDIPQKWELLQALNVPFESFGYHFRLGLGTDRSLVNGFITIPEAEFETLAQKPILSVLLAEAVTVARAISVVVDVEGNASLDGNLFFEKLPVVLDAVAVSSGALAPTLKKAKVPKAPGVPGVRVASKKFSLAAVIRILPNVKHPYHGNRAKMFETIREGMTVREFAEALRKVGLEKASVPKVLSRAIEHGLITVEV